MKQTKSKYLFPFNSLGLTLFLYSLTALVFFLAFSLSYKPNNSFGTIRLIILIVFSPILFKYALHILIAPFYPLVNIFRRNIHFTPAVSVLIPAYNEEMGITKTIQSVIDTKYPHLEIIVINDGSTDNTHKVITSYLEDIEKKYPHPEYIIIYENSVNGGKAKALNKALRFASGEIIVTIDADSIMHKDAIVNLLEQYSDPKVASVAGQVVIGNREKSIGMLQQLEYLYGFYFKQAESIMNAVYIVGGAAASYRKSVLKKVGGFHYTTLTEDIELSTRIQDHGYKVRYAANALVFTEGPSDFKGLCEQRLRWKYGRLQTFFKYRHLFFSFNKKHNFYLSFIILPIAFFTEILLFFEFLLLGIFFMYTMLTFDFMPLIFYILLLTIVITIQVFSDSNPRYHKNILFIAPVAWILFYAIDFVEYQALMRSIWRFLTGN